MSIIFYILGGIVLAYWGFSIYQPSSNRPSVMRENGGIIFAVGIAPLAIGFVTSMIGFMSKLFIGAGVIVLAYWGFSINQLGGGLSGLAYDGFSLNQPSSNRPRVIRENGGIIFAVGIALLVIGFVT